MAFVDSQIAVTLRLVTEEDRAIVANALLCSDPSPVRTTDCAELFPLSVMVNTPGCAPAVVGVNAASIVQLVPTAIVSHVLNHLLGFSTGRQIVRCGYLGGGSGAGSWLPV